VEAAMSNILWSIVVLALLTIQSLVFVRKLREKDRKIAALEAELSNPRLVTGVGEDVASLLADQPDEGDEPVGLPPDLKI
jgi:hypothetical protein